MVSDFAKNKKAQGSPEFNVVISMVALIFIILLMVSFQKQQESFDFQVFIDAKKVATTVADNINMISKNGHGYYRYFSIPETLHGYTDYDIVISGNYLEIDYDDISWDRTLITDNVSFVHLEKGEYLQNCVENNNGQIVINNVCGFSDQGCGTVQSCDPGDNDNCVTCDSPDPVELNQNSRSYCSSYGCSTDEWHIYKIVPTRDGTLNVTFTGNATMAGSLQTDLIFYDYSANGCSNPTQDFQIEPEFSRTYSVSSGSTYILALDSDSPNCGYSGAYSLRTELI